jgi:hypothetical protein
MLMSVCIEILRNTGNNPRFHQSPLSHIACEMLLETNFFDFASVLQIVENTS